MQLSVEKGIYLISLGCPKNQVDSEVLLGDLLQRGWGLVSSPEEADAVVINTCAFLEEAVKEAVETILEMAQRKSPHATLAVLGCLPQRYGKRLLEEMPEVDIWLGSGEFMRLPQLLEEGKKGIWAGEPTYLYDHRSPRVLFNNPHMAYVKIAEGCDHPCTFCLIPKLRGRYRSRWPSSVEEEVRRLGEMEVREVVLVAQDTTSYGRDLGIKEGLEGLLRRLIEVEGVRWIRFLYTYPHPKNFPPSLLELVAGEEKIVPYLDLPIQHVSDRVLRRMGRRTSGREIRGLIETLKEKWPQIHLRGTVMVGFPGEEEEEFKELLSFIEEAEFTHLGAFRYSPEEGTRSYPWKAPSVEVASERYQRVMELQQRISYKRNRGLLGRRVQVLVERKEGRRWVGRTPFQAPEIDGVTYLSGKGMRGGEIVEAEVVEAGPYDLEARVIPS
ncbi:MAG: 30S ribosomal protein S12 methylthiotransferase RimO [Deltaproteobacteria bacterium]|nr:MAG: 30S ribosomal protein S12 methylthiotransferase RimO [Deltaproteobacteria bacterium]